LDIRQTMMSPAVGRDRVHAASCVTQFWLWNDVSIFCNSEVISTSGSAATLTLTVENMSPIVVLGQMSNAWCPATQNVQILNYLITATK